MSNYKENNNWPGNEIHFQAIMGTRIMMLLLSISIYIVIHGLYLFENITNKPQELTSNFLINGS